MKNFKKLFASLTAVLMLATAFPTTVLGASYSTELEGAYDYAYSKDVTTMDSIDNANMYGGLTRVALAKMISNWSMDVLGLTPDTAKECDFADVSESLNADYDNGVTNACQLGLMGVGIDAFRPNDLVTRAEFGTVLSRAMWGDQYDGATPYYADHLAALQDAGIMNSISNPDMTEVRGYVMLMMQRADESGAAEGAGCTAEELLACVTATDYDACVAACSATEEEEVVIDETKAGELTVDLNSGTPEGDIPVVAALGEPISRVPLLKFDVEADGADIVLHAADLEFLGYGDFADVDDISIYNESNVKVSKTKSFTSEELTINFINDFVVKDGGKETLTVVATLAAGAEPNTTYGVSLTNMSTSAETDSGMPIEGNKMKAVVVTNQTVLTFFVDEVTDTITVGEEKKMAAFSLQNEDNFEDVTVQSMTFQVDGIDDETLTNIELFADGQSVADDLEVVNGEIVANMEYVLEKDSNAIDFELKASPTELDADGIAITIEDAEAILAVGNKYGFNITSDVVDGVSIWDITIQGSEVSTSFDKSSIDEAKVEAKDVLLGTLKLKSASTNYTINSYSVCLSTAALGIDKDDIKDLTLGGNSYDTLVLDAATTFCPAGYDEYKFEDISLDAGQQVNLQLVVDFEDTVTEGQTLNVDASFDNHISVTDEDNDEDYTEGTIWTIFSTTSFTDKVVTIKGPSFDLITTTLNDRTVVLGTQEELVYKGKVNIGDADKVILKSINFTDAGTADLTDVIQGATLTIDGKDYSDSAIEAAQIKFTNINHEFAASQSNVVVELAVQLKTDDIVGTPTIILSTTEAGMTLKDSAWDLLDAGNVTVAVAASSTLTLTEQGYLTVSFQKDDVSTTTMNNFTEQAKFSLAGSTDRTLLGKLKLKADREDMKIEKLTFKFDDAGDFYNSYNNFYFRMDGATTDIGSANVTNNGAVTTVIFTFPASANFVVPKATIKYANLYVTTVAHDEDPNASEEGAVDGASVQNLVVSAVEFLWVSSNLDEADLELCNRADLGETDTVNCADDPNLDAEDTTVVVNTIANIQLQQVLKTLTTGVHVVGKLVVTPTSQTRNKDLEGDVLNAYLGSLTITASETAVTLNALTLRKMWGTPGNEEDILGVSDVTGLDADAEIKGVTTYEIVADVTTATPDDASLQLSIANVTTDVGLTSMDGGTNVTLLLAPGNSAEQVVSTK